MRYTRRQVLRQGWKVGGTFLGVAAGWTVFESLRPLGAGARKATVKVGNAGDYADGTATYVGAGRFYVVNAGGELFALSQKCPHLGCRVPFCDSSGRFECGCHGSVFDIAGEWIKGPAPRGMDRFKVVAAGQALTVDTNVVITGPPRGSAQHLTPPKGPSCLQKGG